MRPLGSGRMGAFAGGKAVTKRINVTDQPAKRINITDKPARLIDSHEVGKALGAEYMDLGQANERIRELEAERDRLQAFKDWVHAYLDAKGIQTNPDGPHSKEGCRIGDRMDLVFSERDRLTAELQMHRNKAVDAYWAWQGDGSDLLAKLLEGKA